MKQIQAMHMRGTKHKRRVAECVLFVFFHWLIHYLGNLEDVDFFGGVAQATEKAL